MMMEYYFKYLQVIIESTPKLIVNKSIYNTL